MIKWSKSLHGAHKYTGLWVFASLLNYCPVFTLQWPDPIYIVCLFYITSFCASTHLHVLDSADAPNVTFFNVKTQSFPALNFSC